MTYIRFAEHTFSLDPPDEYNQLMDMEDKRSKLVEKTWYLDKPVSSIWVEPDSECINLLEELFHVYIDSDESFEGSHPVYFSRLPELPEVTANLETDVRGILFGFPNRDVASFIARDNPSDISCNNQS